MHAFTDRQRMARGDGRPRSPRGRCPRSSSWSRSRRPSGDAKAAEEIGRARVDDASRRRPRSSASRAPRRHMRPICVARIRGGGAGPAAARRPPRHGRRPREPSRHRARRRPAARLGNDRHEGRRRARRSACCGRSPRCPDRFARGGALLLVNDEEFRTSPFAHGPRFAGFDACLCFEGGERIADGRRPSSSGARRRRRSGSMRGVAAHAGANPDARAQRPARARRAGRLAGRNATSPPARGAERRPDDDARRGRRSTSCPATGELFVDMRADDEACVRARHRRDPRRDRRRRAARRSGCGSGRAWTWARSPRRRSSGRPSCSAGRSRQRPAAGRATPATWPPHVPLAIDGLGPLGALRALTRRAPRWSTRCGPRPSWRCAIAVAPLLDSRARTASGMVRSAWRLRTVANCDEREEHEMARKQVKSVAGKVVAITGGARGIGKCDRDGADPPRRPGRDRRPRPGARRADRDGAGRQRRRLRARRHRPRVVRALPRRGREGARPDRRADQQRRDHAHRPVRRGDRRDRAADGRHQPARRHLRHQARARADGPAAQRPHRQHRQPGRQGRAPGRRHLLRDQARRRRAERGGPRSRTATTGSRSPA